MKPGPPPAPHPDDLDEEIMSYAARGRSLRQVGRATGVSYATVKRRLAILERQGLIERDETGRITRTVGKAVSVEL